LHIIEESYLQTFSHSLECDEWIEIKSDYTDVEIVTYDDLVDTVVSQFYQ